MFLIELNRNARENYAFFDPSAPIELNLVSPRGYAPRLTESILRGLRAKTLIDVEGKINIENGVIKNGEEQRQEERKEETTESSLQSKEIIDLKKEELSLSEPSNDDVKEKPVKNRKKK